LPASEILTPTQLEALRIYVKERYRQQITSLTVAQVLYWIGRIGGYLGRQSDGRAGVRTLWRGWRDFELLVQMYEALNSSAPG